MSDVHRTVIRDYGVHDADRNVAYRSTFVVDRDGMLEGGDVEEGLGAAAAVGDDRLQRQAGQSVNPDAFTHGSSAQRMEWFRRGFSNGDVRSCDTFSR